MKYWCAFAFALALLVACADPLHDGKRSEWQNQQVKIIKAVVVGYGAIGSTSATIYSQSLQDTTKIVRLLYLGISSTVCFKIKPDSIQFYYTETLHDQQFSKKDADNRIVTFHEVPYSPLRKENYDGCIGDE